MSRWKDVPLLLCVRQFNFQSVLFGRLRAITLLGALNEMLQMNPSALSAGHHDTQGPWPSESLTLWD